jgi:hypothetical protein
MDIIPAFFASDAPANRLDILRGIATSRDEHVTGND